MYKNPLQEWQLYLFVLVYAIVFSIIQVLMFENPSSMRLLDFLLVYFLYERIWHLNKDITLKKIIKTVLWGVVGNVVIIVIGLLIALVFNLFF